MGMPPAIALPIVTMSGCRPHAAVHPPGPADRVWVSSIIRRVPVRSHSSRRPVWNPSMGATIPMLVRAGSVSTAAISPVASARSTAARSLNSTATVVDAGSTAGATLPGRDRVVPSGPVTTKASSTLAVVAVREDQDPGPPGDEPGQAQGPPVGVGGAQGEGPLRQTEPTGELGRHPFRVFGGQHGRDPAERGHPVRHGRHHGSRGVAGHGARVPESEVHVRVTVDIGDPGTVRLGQRQGESTGPVGHPGHRDAGEQVVARRRSGPRTPDSGRGGGHARRRAGGRDGRGPWFLRIGAAASDARRMHHCSARDRRRPW